MRRTKGFSYDPEDDKDVIDHLNKQQNFSTYIKDLVRKDMKGNDIVEIINRQIEKYLKDFDYSKEPLPSRNESFEVDSNDILSILNL